MKNMFVDTTLSAVSTWMTYFVQIALTYLITRGICALIHSPRIRFRLWGCFLFVAVFGWTVFCLPASAGSPVALTTGAVPVTGNRGLWGSLPVSGSWAGHLAWVGVWTWRLYLSIFILCIFQLAWKSLRLRRFLRSGQPPSQEVDLLFQSLCREMKVSRCDLILIAGLRSPATACWWRPHVLLPTELAPFLDTSQLADVLRHELTHVRRHHYLWDRCHFGQRTSFSLWVGQCSVEKHDLTAASRNPRSFLQGWGCRGRRLSRGRIGITAEDLRAARGL